MSAGTRLPRGMTDEEVIATLSDDDLTDLDMVSRLREELAEVEKQEARIRDSINSGVARLLGSGVPVRALEIKLGLSRPRIYQMRDKAV